MDRLTERTSWFWVPCLVALAVVAVADHFTAKHPHFGVDPTFAFGAWFAILVCVGLLAVAGLLGLLLGRPDGYYGD